eukprot:2976733-Lingulodinium_polyedra.AAC.1
MRRNLVCKPSTAKYCVGDDKVHAPKPNGPSTLSLAACGQAADMGRLITLTMTEQEEALDQRW